MRQQQQQQQQLHFASCSHALPFQGPFVSLSRTLTCLGKSWICFTGGTSQIAAAGAPLPVCTAADATATAAAAGIKAPCDFTTGEDAACQLLGCFAEHALAAAALAAAAPPRKQQERDLLLPLSHSTGSTRPPGPPVLFFTLFYVLDGGADDSIRLILETTKSRKRDAVSQRDGQTSNCRKRRTDRGCQSRTMALV